MRHLVCIMLDKEHLVFFDKMAQTAKIALAEVEGQEYTQAIVLLTSKGNEYCSVIENALSAEMTEEMRLIGELDSSVSHILCMWHSGAIDLPSYRFRKMLSESNPDNRNADIFVLTNNGYSQRKLSASMKN